MTIYGITYSSGNMDRSAELCRQSMLKHGIDVAMSYGPNDISSIFKKFNLDIWQQPRGGSYWLWKAYIIYRSLCDSEDDSITVYSDAGVQFTGSIRPILDAMDQDIFLFSNGWPHVHWCKGDVIKAICHNEIYSGHGSFDYKAPERFEQVQASVIIIRNTKFARDFIKEWLLYCQMPGFIDDSPSKSSNHPEFAEHRHDQAILTSVAYKHKIKLHYWPEKHWDNQRHRWPEDRYPIIFLQHRRRDHGKGLGDTEWPD